MKISKEIKIGVLSVIVIVSLVYGINYLKGSDFLENKMTLYGVYQEIEGLEKDGAIMINGYKIGVVKQIELLPSRNYSLLVTFSMEENIQIPKNSVLKIVNLDIIGSKGVNLILGNSPEYVQSGDTLLTDIETNLRDEVNKQVLPLKNKAEELISSIDSVVTVITTVLDKDARENLSRSLRSLDQTFLTMSQTMEKVNGIVDQNDERISSIIKNFEENNDEITKILRNFSALSDDVAKSNIKELLGNLETISKKINNADGSLGLLIQDKELYQNLEKSSKELNELLQDIQLNPKRYVGFSIINLSKESSSPKSK